MKNTIKKIYDFSGTWTGSIIFVLIIIFFIAQAFVIPSGSMKNTLLIGDHLFVKKFSYGIPIPHIPWLEIPILPDFRGDGHLIDGDKPKRGDIVVFRYPKNPKEHFVKREFAVGGDEIIFTPTALYLRPNEGDNFILKNYKNSQIVTLLGKKFVQDPYKFKGIHYEKNHRGFLAAISEYQRGNFAMSPINVDIPESSPINWEFNAFYIKVPKNEFFMIGDNRDNSNDSRFWGSVPYKYIVGKPWFVYFSWNSKKEIRWERIGRSIDTLENNSKFIYAQP